MFALNRQHAHKHRFHTFLCGIGVFFILVVADQLIKQFVVGHIANLCNEGIAFGVRLPSLFFIILWIGIVVALGFFWRGVIFEKFFVQLPFVCIFAGAVGNVIDRVRYGCVVDYVPFLHISSFNFADVLITVGAGLLLFYTIRK